MSIVVGTGKNARVRLNTGELQNRKEAEKKTETPAEGTDVAKGKGGKSGGKDKSKGKEEAPKTETPADGTNVTKGKEETSKADTPVEGAGGNENQTEE